MKYTTTSAAIAAFMMIGSAQAAILAGDSVTIDFNTATDVYDFLDIRDDTPSDASIGSSHNATGGTGATKGAISAANVGVNTFEGANRVFDADPDGPFTLTDATWYQFGFTLIKTATADEFDVTITMNQLNADGTFSSLISTHNAIITNADLYTESGGNGVLAGFTFVHDAEPDTTTNEYDNLNITITTVPEPSSAALLALGGLALILRRRK